VQSYAILTHYIFEIKDAKVLKKLSDKSIKAELFSLSSLHSFTKFLCQSDQGFDLESVVFFGVADVHHKHEHSSFGCPKL
jgi:hypothetical protein